MVSDLGNRLGFWFVIQVFATVRARYEAMRTFIQSARNAFTVATIIASATACDATQGTHSGSTAPARPADTVATVARGPVAGFGLQGADGVWLKPSSSRALPLAWAPECCAAAHSEWTGPAGETILLSYRDSTRNQDNGPNNRPTLRPLDRPYPQLRFIVGQVVRYDSTSFYVTLDSDIAGQGVFVRGSSSDPAKYAAALSMLLLPGADPAASGYQIKPNSGYVERMHFAQSTPFTTFGEGFEFQYDGDVRLSWFPLVGDPSAPVEFLVDPLGSTPLSVWGDKTIVFYGPGFE